MDGKNGATKITEEPTLAVPTVGANGLRPYSQDLHLQQAPDIHPRYTSIVGGVLATINLNGGQVGLAKVLPDGTVNFFINWN